MKYTAVMAIGLLVQPDQVRIIETGELPDRIRGFDVVWATDDKEGIVSSHYNEVAESDEDHVNGIHTDMIDFAAIQKDMKAQLEPLGIWDDEKFALWNILRVAEDGS